MTKGEARKVRKDAAAGGRPWTPETSAAGNLVVRSRTTAEERRHEQRMERWTKRLHLDPDWR